MPFSPLAKTVRHDSVRLQRGPSEPALEQLELLKRQDLRNRDCRRRRGFAEEGEVSVKMAAVEPESSLDYPDPHIVHCVRLPYDENGWRWLR